jgi:chromosome segregation ATPase
LCHLPWWAKPVLAMMLIWMGVGLGSAESAGNPAEARKRIQAIDVELKQVEQGMTETVRELRENNKRLETASEQLEKEDAGFRQLKQELKDLEKRVDEVKKELDRRVAAVDRFAGYYEAYHQALVRIEALRLQERRLSAERSVLLTKIEKQE